MGFCVFLGRMQFVQRFFLYLSLLALLCVIAGLFKPWALLWWEDKQNRKKILKIYGTAAFTAFVIYCLLFLI